MTCPMLAESGVYVLGALSPAERQAYERHMTTCAECRSEVANLAVLPGLLGRLDEASLAEPETIEAPPTVLPAVVHRMRRSRRNRRLAVLTGAVAAACAALVIGLTVPTHPSSPRTSAGGPVSSAPATPSPSAAVMSPMQRVGDQKVITASVALHPFTGGTRIDGVCTYNGVPSEYPGAVNFVMYVYSKNGHREEIGSWAAVPGDSLKFSGMTWWPLSDLSHVELVGPDGSALLRYTPS
jgi:hypothetical protein